MTQTHPITPPPELLEHWEDQHYEEGENYDVMLIQAYQAGADQELEACIQLLDINGCPGKWIDMLRAARRPKPPSLREQALKAIGVPTKFGEARVIEHREHELVRRALEALPND